MQRWTIVVIGAFLVALGGALVWKGGQGVAHPSAPSAAVDAGPQAALTEAKSADAASNDLVLAHLVESDGGGPLAFGEGVESPAPSLLLPSGSPKTVRFGVILVQYRGAQATRASARSKEEAATLARELAEAAKTDFKGQVAKGDPGSTDDAGRIPRGVLEPTTEFTLFTLAPGAVSDVIDTPRGFWIVHRFE